MFKQCTFPSLRRGLGNGPRITSRFELEQAAERLERPSQAGRKGTRVSRSRPLGLEAVALAVVIAG